MSPRKETEVTESSILGGKGHLAMRGVFRWWERRGRAAFILEEIRVAVVEGLLSSATSVLLDPILRSRKLPMDARNIERIIHHRRGSKFLGITITWIHLRSPLSNMTPLPCSKQPRHIDGNIRTCPPRAKPEEIPGHAVNCFLSPVNLQPMHAGNTTGVSCSDLGSRREGSAVEDSRRGDGMFEDGGLARRFGVG